MAPAEGADSAWIRSGIRSGGPGSGLDVLTIGNHLLVKIEQDEILKESYENVLKLEKYLTYIYFNQINMWLEVSLYQILKSRSFMDTSPTKSRLQSITINYPLVTSLLHIN